MDWVLHLVLHLAALAASYDMLVYGVLFGVIFIKTGVVSVERKQHSFDLAGAVAEVSR